MTRDAEMIPAIAVAEIHGDLGGVEDAYDEVMRRLTQHI